MFGERDYGACSGITFINIRQSLCILKLVLLVSKCMETIILKNKHGILCIKKTLIILCIVLCSKSPMHTRICGKTNPDFKRVISSRKLNESYILNPFSSYLSCYLPLCPISESRKNVKLATHFCL